MGCWLGQPGWVVFIPQRSITFREGRGKKTPHVTLAQILTPFSTLSAALVRSLSSVVSSSWQRHLSTCYVGIWNHAYLIARVMVLSYYLLKAMLARFPMQKWAVQRHFAALCSKPLVWESDHASMLAYSCSFYWPEWASTDTLSCLSGWRAEINGVHAKTPMSSMKQSSGLSFTDSCSQSEACYQLQLNCLSVRK